MNPVSLTLEPPLSLFCSLSRNSVMGEEHWMKAKHLVSAFSPHYLTILNTGDVTHLVYLTDHLRNKQEVCNFTKYFYKCYANIRHTQELKEQQCMRGRRRVVY